MSDFCQARKFISPSISVRIEEFDAVLAETEADFREVELVVLHAVSASIALRTCLGTARCNEVTALVGDGAVDGVPAAPRQTSRSKGVRF
eukprot:984975-Pleurochrysis_carterae.AAC.1